MPNSSLYIVSLDVVKNHIGFDPANHDSDLSLELAIQGVTRSIARYTKREFIASTGTRYYTPDQTMCARVDDVLSLSAVRADYNGDGVWETTLSSTCYYLAPVNATVGPAPGPYYEIKIAQNSSAVMPKGVERGLQVNGTWGYASAIPADVIQFALFQIALEFRGRDTPMGLTGGRDFSQQLQLSAGLHPWAQKGLDHYRDRVIA